MKDKLVAGLLAIFLGAYGIHHFYLGDTRKGVIYLLVTLLTAGIGGTVLEIIGIIEGIKYLTMSDEEWADFNDQPVSSSSRRSSTERFNRHNDGCEDFNDNLDNNYRNHSDDTKGGSKDIFF